MNSLSRYFMVVVLAIMSLGYSSSLWALGKYAPDQGCLADLNYPSDPAALGFSKAHGLAGFRDWTFPKADTYESYYSQGRLVDSILSNFIISTNQNSTIPDVCNGVHDATIRMMAKELAVWGRPCLAMLWPEFNWADAYANASNYGNDPSLYRQAWIRVWNIFQEEGDGMNE